MAYSDVLKELRKAEHLTESEEYEEPLDTEEVPEETETPEEPEIELAMMVKVIDADSFIADDLELSEEDFEAFKAKVEEGATAIVFDIDDDDPSVVDIVYEDGLEIFKIPKINLQEIADEDDEAPVE